MIEAISEKTIMLLLHQTQPLTSKDIAVAIGMSESSVKHNMKIVKEIIAQTHAILKSAPGKGIWIEADDKQRDKLQELVHENRDKAYSFNYRRNYILHILFQNNADYTIQIFADDLGVGKNVIVKDLESIEKWLRFFDIKLTRIRNRGIMIEGGEFDIRQAIIYNNTSLMDNMVMDLDRPDDLDFRVSKTFYNYFKKTYVEDDIYKIQDMLLNAEFALDYHFEDFSFIQLMEYVNVCVHRIKQQCMIKERTVLHRCKITTRIKEVASKLILGSIEESCERFDLEVHCMAAQLTLYGAYEDALNDSFIKDEFYESEARNFIDSLQSIMINRKILINESLINDVASLFKKKKMQKSYQIMNSNYLRYDVKRQLPSLYAIVLANIQPLEYALNAKFTENDIIYFVMLIDNAMEEENDEITVLFITSFDDNTANYLMNKIKRSMQGIRIEKRIHPEDYKEIDRELYDVMLTTVLMDDDHILKISRRVDTYDLDLIEREVETKRKIKQKIITKNQQLFSEDLICYNFKAKRKEEVLERAVTMMTQQGYVTSRFYDVLMQRENFVSTAIGNGVAIPHGFKTEIKRSGIAVFKLERPIDWTENEKVEIVFIIAIDFDDAKEIHEFFAKFYALIDDKERLQDILDAKNKHDIYQTIEDVGTLYH